ncbi:SDR family NAD(P)-dependent oxidoreductase [Paraburkholderia sp. J41]|uniref:SDR family NAD(P)-dependent oxidoreductase n=1 Tax=Paraburkholderia sp. J41 TaxID=2805433 RepID=UPI002AC327C6|nr:SDR family NAD(P)-dependent oxidoreductase [Paraburkholderia sp. J41]
MRPIDARAWRNGRRRGARCAQARRSHESDWRRDVGIVADVSSVADIDRVMATVRARLGRVDVLFANAGTSHSPTLDLIDETAFDAMVGLNFKGVFFTCVRAPCRTSCRAFCRPSRRPLRRPSRHRAG